MSDPGPWRYYPDEMPPEATDLWITLDDLDHQVVIGFFGVDGCWWAEDPETQGPIDEADVIAWRLLERPAPARSRGTSGRSGEN